ncbi:hypothetical protein [Streptomyces sp. NPDC060027]
MTTRSAERTAVGQALDDLTDHPPLPADAERIANAQLDGEVRSSRATPSK